MFKKVLILSALLGTLFVAQASTLNASSPTTTQSEQAKHSATGRVIDKSGAPIAYANVSVRKASGEVVAKISTRDLDFRIFAIRSIVDTYSSIGVNSPSPKS